MDFSRDLSLDLDWPILAGESTAKLLINMVGTTGLEPATSSVSRKRSNQLSYAPAKQYLAVYQDRGGRERWKAARGQHVVPSFTNEEPLFAGNRADPRLIPALPEIDSRSMPGTPLREAECIDL